MIRGIFILVRDIPESNQVSLLKYPFCIQVEFIQCLPILYQNFRKKALQDYPNKLKLAFSLTLVALNINK